MTSIDARQAARSATAPIPTSASLAIVGVGPRGTAVVERLAALRSEQAHPVPLDLHLVEPTQFGAGAVWRTDQDPDLCMNTLAAASTLFTDESYTGPGPVRPGPTFHQWAEQVRSRGIPQHWGQHTAELLDMKPWSHPSRALFGHYLVWCLDQALAALASTGVVTVHRHPRRATGLRPLGSGGFEVQLDGGEPVRVDAVVLALGWTPTQPGGQDVSLGELSASAREAGEVTWVAPDSPINQDLRPLRPGQDVLVRGLGMGFFDLLSRLTIGRGGRFESLEGGRLRYHPSGDEPVLHAASARGVPFLSKTRYGSLPPKSTLRATREGIRLLPRPLPVERLWEPILRDALADHARVLVRTHPELVERPDNLVDDLESLPWDAPLGEAQGLADFRIDLSARFVPADWEFPAAGRHFAGPAAMDSFVLDLLGGDLDQADLGHDSAVKAGLWAISSARKLVGDASDFDGVDAEGDRWLQRINRFGGMLGSGPPAFRNEQLLALLEAGVVHMVGPEATTSWAGGRFVLESPAVPGSRVSSRVLVDAWMRSPHPSRSADPLVRGLTDAGLLRPHTRTDRHGSPVQSGAIDVIPGTGEVVDAQGQPVVGLFAIGVPVDPARRDSLQAPVPRVDSVTLREAGMVAARFLELSVQSSARAA